MKATIGENMPTENDADNKQSKKSIGPIIAVIVTMIGLFGGLSSFLPGLTPPIATLLLGLGLTVALVVMEYWSVQTAGLTWAGTSIVLMIVYLVISQSATVAGQVIRDDGMPISGLMLVLTNSSGIEQRVVTDQEGRFEIANVPDGRYTITANDRLLYTDEVPSGWQRILSPSVGTGGLIFAGPITNAPSPTPTIAITMPPADTPTDMPTSTYTPSVGPTDAPTNTLTPVPPTATNTDTPAVPTNTPTITLTNTPRPPTNTPTLTPTPTDIPEELILLYEEDFEDGDADTLTIVNGAAYVTVDDENRVYLVGHDSRQTFFHLGNAEWSDYRVEIHFKPIDLIGPSYDNLGFGVRSDNYYSGYWLTLPGGWWQRRINNQGEDMTEWIDASLIRDDWNTLYIECRNGVIRTMLNELVIPDLHDDAFQQGKIGFMTEPGIYMLVDDIRVWSLEAGD